jgi:hypothetical protein
MPPALAVGILPFVITAPSFWYPVSVTIGTIALTVCSLAHDRLRSIACVRRAKMVAIQD